MTIVPAPDALPTLRTMFESVDASNWFLGVAADMKRFPRLKFCGMTREEDVEAAIQAGADAIGLNFYPKSKRFIEPARAQALSRLANARIMRVGVFVNASPSDIAAITRECPLDAIQLHGDESQDWLTEAESVETLNGLPIIRAMSYRGAEDDEQLGLWCRLCSDPSSPVSAILLDAHDPIFRGGTGKTARWDLLYPRPASFSKAGLLSDGNLVTVPLLLAGGITVDNVQNAIQIARPDGLDVASGIETSPGIKSARLMTILSEIAHSEMKLR